jgi:hypothetical protein
MPSLSINSKDLDSLGLNLKDLLKAIAQTKSSGDDVIKIKKRRKKVKRIKTKGNKLSGLSKVSTINPFPPAQKMSNLPPQVSGGGGASFQPPPFQTRIEVKNEPQKQTDNSTQQQLEKFQNEMSSQIKNINDNQKTTGLYILYNNQYRDQWGNYQVPSGLANLQPRSYMRGEPEQVDMTDRFGIVPTNNFDNTAVTNEGSQITELPPDEVIQEDIPTETPTSTEQSDIAKANVNELEIPLMDLLPSQTPTSSETKLTSDNVFDIMKEEMKTIPIEQIQKRGRGRPPKNPLTKENIEANRKTRSNTGSELVNPSNITPDKYAKEEMKKQEVINSYFTTPRKVVERKPVQVSVTEQFIPTPPTELKPAKVPMPSRSRAKSENSAIILG